MKKRFLFGSIILMSLLLCGCVTTNWPSVDRFVETDKLTIQYELEKVLERSEYKIMPDGRWEVIILKEKDPITGLITISQKPMFSLRLTITYIENDRGTLVSIQHFIYRKGTPIHKGGEKPTRVPDSIINQLDSAVSRARFFTKNK